MSAEGLSTFSDSTLERETARATSSETRLRTVVMCGPSLNHANTGDRLLVSALVNILRHDLGVERILYASIGADPRVSRDLPGVEIVSPRRKPWRLLWRTFRADAFVIAGAVSFHENQRTMLKQALLGWLCRLGGGRVVVNAASVQPLRDWICRLLFRATYAAAHWFTVRDHASEEHVEALGLRPLPPRSPDPGILCPAPARERVWQILAAEGIPTDRPLFAITPHFFVNHGRYCDPRYPSFEIEYENFPDEALDQYYDGLATIAESLSRSGNVVFVPMCTKTPPGDDRVAAEWVRGRMACTKATYSLRGEYTIAELAGVLSRCTLLFASRLHAYAIGVAVGVPSLAVGFHPKVNGLAEELSLGDWVFPLRDFSGDVVIATVAGILADVPAARARVRTGLLHAAAKAKADFIRGVTGKAEPALA